MEQVCDSRELNIPRKQEDSDGMLSEAKSHDVAFLVVNIMGGAKGRFETYQTIGSW
jgi:hypothetical protein